VSGLALFASYTGGYGGSERLLVDFASALEPPVAVACPPGPLAEELRGRGTEPIPLAPRPLDLRRSIRDRVAAPARLLAFRRELGRAVAEREPALLVAWNSRALLGAGRLPSGTRLVFQQNELLPGPLIARAVRRAARRADLTIALSRTIADDLSLPAEVVPGGVDPGAYEHGWPRPGPRTALYLGALVGWKRPDLALEAVALATRELPDLQLVVAGGPIGDDRAVLEGLRGRAEQPDLAGRVTFAGHVSDPRRLLAESHCLLHCADREPYGMVMVEALAAGLPVVAPAAGGPVEIVDGSCGRLYRPGDAEAAAEALAEVLHEPEPLGLAARRKAEQAHTREAAQSRYGALIEPLRGGQ